MNDNPLVLYLLHFTPALGRAQHYMGITSPTRLRARLREHRDGRGAKLTAAARAAGCKLTLVRVLDAVTYDDERRYKRAGHYKRHCPICSGEHIDPSLAQLEPMHPRPVPHFKPLAWPGNERADPFASQSTAWASHGLTPQALAVDDEPEPSDH